MWYAMVATIMKGDKIIGCRVVNVMNGKVIDMTEEKLLDFLLEGNQITNLMVVGQGTLGRGAIRGSNGVLSRYSELDSKGKLINKNKKPLVILCIFSDDNNVKLYGVCDYTGKIWFAYENKAITYATLYGVANGRITKGYNGKRYISAINGSYKQFDLKELYVEALEQGAEKQFHGHGILSVFKHVNVRLRKE